jgi:hypothetical protein
MLRRLFCVILFGSCVALGLGAAADTSRFNAVDVAPTKTSIYIGTVSMTMPRFERHSGTYTAGYTAKVFPLWFYNESGKLSVDLSDEQLQTLAHGQPVEFHGRAVRDDGEERRVEGKATPADAQSGKLKVRVFVSKSIELIFNTTYRFVGDK